MEIYNSERMYIRFLFDAQCLLQMKICTLFLLFLFLVFLWLEPCSCWSRINFLSVLDKIFTLSNLHFCFAQGTLRLFFLKNFLDLRWQLLYFLSVFLNDFCRHNSVLDLWACTGWFYSHLEHFTVCLANKSDRSVQMIYLVSGRKKLLGYYAQFLPALTPCSCCSTHTVEILCKLGRHVIVDDDFDTLDIQTSCCQVCGEQKVNLIISESLECL